MVSREEKHRAQSRERTVAILADIQYHKDLKHASQIADSERRRESEEGAAARYRARREHRVMNVIFDVARRLFVPKEKREEYRTSEKKKVLPPQERPKSATQRNREAQAERKRLREEKQAREQEKRSARRRKKEAKEEQRKARQQRKRDEEEARKLRARLRELRRK